ncbi:MAG: hypothetical protein GX640_23340, partial [Fibrobacter sp.]|nr:hypothetical protein [Fibrobacter sp.]
MKKISFLIALLFPLTLIAAPKFPFPHNAKYPYGIKPASIDNGKIQKAYDDFIKEFYEENGDKARIRFDDPNLTVSEGIGYGMLITVYMDNATNNTQGKFDKLWRYYNSYLNNNGLMHWRISGFGGVSGQNAATDAEMDVAMALVQAYKQWGDEKYLNDAKSLIDKIYQFEVNSNGYLKPGDSWDDKKNPSYFSTAALESFKRVNSRDWAKVISTSYSLLQKCANASTGLVPDWCSESGAPQGDFYYDAIRTPWRIAWDYVWFGRSEAKSFCSKIASWINTKTGGNPAAIIDGYTLDGGNKGNSLVSTFLGAFACAGMVDASYQTWLNNAYSKQEEMVSKSENYFSSSLKMIYLLLLSGNMPDLWADNIPQKFKLNISIQPSNA